MIRRTLAACLLGALLLAPLPVLARGIETYVVTVATTGAEGSASGSADSPGINGHIAAIYLDFSGSATPSTDVTVSYKTRGGNVLATSNTVTDALIYPHAKPVDNANAAITDAHTPFVLNDRLTISVAQSSSLSAAVTAYIYVSDSQ